MIVDDEIYVVALIRKMIPWEKYQMNVEATANDGVTALELVREINPDLVVVDIRMPGYDGISFMDRVREFNRDVRFIVISGHKQFNYARGALRNNVEDYLLKPINQEELENAIQNTQVKLIARQENTTKLKEMEGVLDSRQRQLRKIFIEALLNGEIQQLSQGITEINERFSIKFEDGFFQIVVLSLELSIGQEESKQDDLIVRTFAKEVEKSLQQVCHDVLITERQIFSIFLINYAKEREEEVMECLKKQVAKRLAPGKKFDDLFFRICLTRKVGHIGDIEISIQSMRKLLLARTALPEGKFIEEKDIHEGTIQKYDDEYFERVLALLDMGEIARYIKEKFSKAYYLIEEDTLLYYKIFSGLVEKIYIYFQNMGVVHEREAEFRAKFETSYLNATKSSEYARILIERIEELLKENHLTDSREVPAVRIAKRYIRRHYNEDISLSRLAAIVHISPVYLSRLFKKSEGINFLDYLNQYRIEVAKKMLVDVCLQINQVSELSGFKNTKYFSKVFKKIIGITPSEYRRRHLGKEEE